MKGTIIGFEPVNYTKRDTGEQVKGITLILTCRSNNVIGLTSKTEYINAKSPFYKEFLPYLNGDKDMEELLNSEIFIDFQPEKRGNYTINEIVDIELMPAPKKV